MPGNVRILEQALRNLEEKITKRVIQNIETIVEKNVKFCYSRDLMRKMKLFFQLRFRTTKETGCS